MLTDMKLIVKIPSFPIRILNLLWIVRIKLKKIHFSLDTKAVNLI